MKQLSIPILLLTVLVLGCGRLSLTAEEQTLFHNGTEREYRLHVPESYSSSGEKVPLLLVFHGYTSSARTIERYSHFDELAEQENFIVVYPQGTILEGEGETHWNVGGWTNASTTDDVAFVGALLDSLVAEYTIDEQRIYSTGMSNGGFMSFALACELSDRIAAIASVTGSMTPETYATCAPERAVPVLQFHGTADEVVPYDGSKYWTTGIDSVLTYWQIHNQTDTAATFTEMPDLDTRDGSTVERYAYENGTDRVAVIHYKVLDGGHDWFGAWGNMDIQASELIWEFVSQYDLSGKIE